VARSDTRSVDRWRKACHRRALRLRRGLREKEHRRLRGRHGVAAGSFVSGVGVGAGAPGSPRAVHGVVGKLSSRRLQTCPRVGAGGSGGGAGSVGGGGGSGGQACRKHGQGDGHSRHRANVPGSGKSTTVFVAQALRHDGDGSKLCCTSTGIHGMIPDRPTVTSAITSR